MTTTTTPLLRNVAVCIPLTVGVATALFDLSSTRSAPRASSLLVLGNLAVALALPRFPGILAAIASEQEQPALLMGLVLA